MHPTVPDSPADPGATQRRLLVVDDEPAMVEMLREVLGSIGYSVETAANGAEAMRRIESGNYDLIISDLWMPEMDGQKLYDAVRARDKDLASRIIFVTGDTVSPKSRTFLESTGNRCLSKPFSIAEIERVVASFLQQAPVGAGAGNAQQSA